ncbi:MAG TPA: hydrogenase 4 subunit B [Acetobacteraceae bacterium]|jgi:hydrogenase-4 component B|nr:hydrogenase 4 subunit B [Acetobacteraceae bacterium]
MIALALTCIVLLLCLAVAGAFAALSPSGRHIVYGGALAISAASLLVALFSLGAAPSVVTLPLGLPWTGAHFRLDPLAAFFLVVVGLGSAGSSLYALGHGRYEHEPQRVLPFYPVFLAGLNLVVVADDAFSFLFAWELMSLASWALVMSHHRETGNAHAGYVYIIMASFSGLALLLCFGLLAGPTGGYSFDAMRAAHPTPGIAALALVLALIGAGSKAGIVPLHAWLPLAHPAAPSHVSALMSGVMTKVAVYGFVRIAFDLLGPPAWWSGTMVLAVGGVTAVLGVLYALMEHDLKRLLAYHTVENIGIIFIGLGLALAFGANQLPVAAALGLTAALFHVFNHSVFKSLLFFGTGAVLTATGERDMDHLGGLIHRMPKTAFAFLVGCVAISALPPLNGFVSEWLTFQAILLHPDLPQWGLKLAIPADGALLALSAALAAACFVKAFGVTFLGRPRTRAAADAREVDSFSLAAMFGFAALCLLAGILPGAVIDLLAPVTQMLTGASMPTQLDVAWLSIVPVESARSSYNGLLVFLFIALSASLAALVVRRFAAHGQRRAPAWDCGFPDPRPETQYTGASFAQPIRRVFGAVVFRTRETVTMPPPGDIAPARIEKHISDPIWDTLYAPVAGAVWHLSLLLNHLQFLTIRRYLGFVFAALVILLLVLALWQ